MTSAREGETGDRIIRGRATTEGTAAFRDRFATRTAPDHFRRVQDLWLSSLGIGTYLGEPDEEDDRGYRDSLIAAVKGGLNVIDTAINYRFQRSERTVGGALRALVDEGSGGGLRREEIVVATKGGFLPFDGGYPTDARAWFREALLKPGIARPEEVVADCHVMTPRYLEAQIDWSRRNLGLETLDIYYLHNPETQLQEVTPAEFLRRVRAAFELLEKKVAEGRIGIYGVATWDGLRVPPDRPGHLSLQTLLLAAEQVGGKGHHFRAVQLPLNVLMPEACLQPTQVAGERHEPLAEAARAAGLVVMASGSLLQGRTLRALRPPLHERLPGATTGAQRNLQIVRSAPGIATALVGMKRLVHVEENLAVTALPRLPEQEALAILQACTRL